VLILQWLHTLNSRGGTYWIRTSDLWRVKQAL
jgi:hypothetical protein